MCQEPDKRESISRQVQGYFREGQVLVSRQEDIDFLAESGYGTREDRSALILLPWEALYLVSERRLKVLKDDAEVVFQDLLPGFQTEDSDVWSKYLLYRDLRSRGYVVRGSIIGETGFRVYERGAYPSRAAKYVVFPVREVDSVPVERLWAILNQVQGMKKKLIVAVMDRRGEIVYYSLTQFNLY